MLTAVLALAGCADPASPAPSGSGFLTGGPSGTETTPGATPSPTPSLPATGANLVSYIESANELSPETYVDAYDTFISFSTPSGNISCGFALGDNWVACWVDENSWPSVPEKACEDGEWVPDWVEASNAGVRRGACLSEQPFPMPGEVLPYGSSVYIGAIGCRSEATYLACANMSTGNGFVISKAIYHTYGPVLG
jgi:hypothetical protein